MARNTSVTLGVRFDEFVHEEINAGRFQSVSEVVRAGLTEIRRGRNKIKIKKRGR